MNFRTQILGAIFGILALSGVFAEEPQKPNIVFVLCDDLGYGDVQCLNPEKGKILTPAVDRLAREGMIFTDAHSGSSVCTPTRYGLLTGRYSWRTRLQRGVVQGFAPCLIDPDRPTVASFVKQQGYHTAILGTWHLDFQYLDPETSEMLTAENKKSLPPVGARIPDGPLQHGFDYFHGFHHAGSMKSVIENDAVIMHDDEINMLPRLSRKAIEYIDGRAKEDSKQPFFLYVPFGSPHTPIVPTKPWQGKSGLGSYADFVMETDDGFGGILKALDRNGFTENTLVIFSADNGCSRAAGIKKLQKQGHYPSAHMRGSKTDLWRRTSCPFHRALARQNKTRLKVGPTDLLDRPDGDLFGAVKDSFTRRHRRRQRQLSTGVQRRCDCFDSQGNRSSFRKWSFLLPPGQVETVALQRIRRLVLTQ